MPCGLVRSGNFSKGTPIILPHEFGNKATNPEPFGNVIPQSNPTLNSNPVTWVPSPSYFGNGVGFLLQANPPVIIIAQGTVGEVIIPITDLQGSVVSVTLSATGAPAGIVIGFAPDPATTNSVATISVAATVPVGKYLITIPGTSGTETENTNIRIVVIASGSPPTSDFLLQEDGVSLFELEDSSGFILLEI